MINSGDSKDIIEDLLELNKGIYHSNNYLEFNDDWTWSPRSWSFQICFVMETKI